MNCVVPLRTLFGDTTVVFIYWFGSGPFFTYQHCLGVWEFSARTMFKKELQDIFGQLHFMVYPY